MDKIHELENWVIIPEHTTYEISDQGRVKSFNLDKLRGRILKPQVDSGGYLHVTLISDDGRKGTHRIHKLVMYNFTSYSGGLTINHIDGVKVNNRLSNLEAISLQENSYHRDYNGLGNHGTRQINNTTGYVGVCFNNYNGKYKAYITYMGTPRHLGYFECILDAAMAYNAASLLYHVNNLGIHIGALNEISLL